MFVKFDSTVIGGTANPAPAVAISCKSNTDSVSGRVISKTTTWTISGVLLAKSGSDVKTQANTLLALFTNIDGSEKFEMIDGTTVSTLDGSDTNIVNGLSIDLPSFPDGSGVAWGTKLNYTITAKGTFWVTTATEWADYRIDYSTNHRNVQSKKISGTYFNPGSADIKTSCESWINTNFAEDHANYSRTKSIQLNKSTDGTDYSCSFNITDTGRYKAMPDNSITNVAVNKKLEYAPGGQHFLDVNVTVMLKKGTSFDIAQSFVEGDTLAAYSSLAVINKSITQDEYTGTYNYNIKYLNYTGTKLEESESISIQHSIDDFVIKPVLGGDPVKQDTVKRPARATQSGYIISIGQSAPNDPEWPDNLKTKEVTYHTAERGALRGELHYRTEWHYEFEFVNTPNFNGY